MVLAWRGRSAAGGWKCRTTTSRRSRRGSSNGASRGRRSPDLLQGFCKRCSEAGLDLSRALALIDTLHPVYEGRAFHWRNDGVATLAMTEYGRTDQGEAAENWRRSVFYHLLSSGKGDLRRRLGFGDPCDFPQLQGFRDDGHVDYLGMVHRFAGETAIGEMDCVYSHWLTRNPEGFRETDVAALRRLVPVLALAVKSASLARIAETLVEVYLGRDAGRRVLSGRIARGVADKIDAVLWFSDLRGFTTITDTAPPGEIIPLLNDYAGAVISAIEDAGGDVLKLIGDGILAIFKAGDRTVACGCALKAEADLRRRLHDLNQSRAAEGRPGHHSLSRAAHRRGLLRQHRGREPARFHGRGAGRQRGEPGRRHVPVRRPERLVVERFRRGGSPRGASPHRFRGALRPARVGKAQELFTLDETA